MPDDDANTIAPRHERMRALVETAKFLHPHFTMKSLAQTLAAPIDTVRAVLYRDLIVSHATIERWSLALEAGIERDTAVAARRHANARRALQRVRGTANATASSFIRGDPDETGGAAI